MRASWRLLVPIFVLSACGNVTVAAPPDSNEDTGVASDPGLADPGIAPDPGLISDPGLAPDPGTDAQTGPDIVAPDNGIPDGHSPDGCVPFCSGRECGEDGCGGRCGTCPVGQECVADGQCECVQGVGVTCCEGSALCPVDGCGNVGDAFEVCPNGCDLVTNTCIGCAADCSGKQCGSDGCGGACGVCTAPRFCSSGICIGCDLALDFTIQSETFVANGTWTITSPEGTWGPYACAEDWTKDITIPPGGPGMTIVWQFPCPAPTEAIWKLFQDSAFIDGLQWEIRDPAGSSLFGYKTVNCVVVGYAPEPWDCKDGLEGIIKFSCEFFTQG